MSSIESYYVREWARELHQMCVWYIVWSRMQYGTPVTETALRCFLFFFFNVYQQPPLGTGLRSGLTALSCTCWLMYRLWRLRGKFTDDFYCQGFTVEKPPSIRQRRQLLSSAHTSQREWVDMRGAFTAFPGLRSDFLCLPAVHRPCHFVECSEALCQFPISLT